MGETVKSAGEALSPAKWREALACGDMRDRFPCEKCGATGILACQMTLGPAEVRAAVEYINGYGWRAATKLATPPIDAGEE